jgi:hypothetical protein
MYLIFNLIKGLEVKTCFFFQSKHLDSLTFCYIRVYQNYVTFLSQITF